MVHMCCADKCRNVRDKENGITLHKFPLKNPKLLAQWVEAVKKEKDNWKPTKNSQLCSAHFKKTDFYPNQSIKLLRENVVPSIFAHSPAVDEVRSPIEQEKQAVDKVPSPVEQENLKVRSTAKDIKIIFCILPVIVTSSTPSTSTCT